MGRERDRSSRSERDKRRRSRSPRRDSDSKRSRNDDRGKRDSERRESKSRDERRRNKEEKERESSKPIKEERKDKEDEDEKMRKRRERAKMLFAAKGIDIKGDAKEDAKEDTKEAAAVDKSPPSESNSESKTKMEEDEVDPLDAFMAGIEEQVQKEMLSSLQKKPETTRYYSDDENYEMFSDEDEEEQEEAGSKNARLRKMMEQVDHTQISYPPFNKNFYIAVPEIANMTQQEIEEHRDQLDYIRVRGKNCPAPIKRFTQCGLIEPVLQVCEKNNFHTPTPIQAQAIPAIMSGHDMIGCAKTGSGKTLAFLLPLLRQVLDQPTARPGEGPAALIMAPTRELAMQIYSDCRKFTKKVNLRCVCVYGGTGVAGQISELKRGADVIVCTPGRMIDVLCTNSGRVTNLKRVTYLVLDEADRMFDMGFEPQIMRIISNTRPDRQTVMFSATFPRSVEALARKILQHRPLEIVVGGRSVVAKEVKQIVEVLPEDHKFLRLVDLLKEWEDKGLILIFVDRQESCDHLYTEITRKGFPCLSLHGGKDQQDRDFTIDDFKRHEQTIMIATSVAARGLDVKDLNLVINYDVPNHMEDYVHRCGRTGRAGSTGTAITFITPDEERYAPDIVKALQLSKAEIPEEMITMASKFVDLRKTGEAVGIPGSGYGGKGFKFNEEEERKKEEQKKMQRMAYGVEEEEEEEEIFEEDEVLVPEGVTLLPTPATRASTTAGAKGRVGGGQQRAMQLAQNMTRPQPGVVVTGDHAEEEFEINDYPQSARKKITQKDTLSNINEWTGAAITARGSFIPPGRNPPPGERKLYLYIEGPDAMTVKKAKSEILRVLSEAADTGMPEPKPMYGKYSVL